MHFLTFQIAQAEVPRRKRKQGDEDGTLALPMDERLNALVLDKPTNAAATHPPKTDNQIHLLLQVSYKLLKQHCYNCEFDKFKLVLLLENGCCVPGDREIVKAMDILVVLAVLLRNEGMLCSRL